MKLIDPLNIPKKDLPLVMFTDNLWSYLSYSIRNHTHGAYSHVGLVVHQEQFASQYMTFKERDIRDYMKNHRLKFYKVLGTIPQRRRIIKRTEERLALPWYKTFYDYIGIIGQKTGLRFIQTPGLYYCSEITQHILKQIYNFKKYRSPSEMNKRMAELPKKFEYYGHFIVD